MRKHLLSLLICTAAASAGALVAASGCREKPEPPEPIPAAGPIPLNHFVRAWASVVDIPAGDEVKSLHRRDDTLFVYTKSGQILSMAADTGKVRWVQQIRSTDRAGIRPPVVQKERIVIPTSSTLELFEPTEGHFLRSVPLQVAARSNAVGFGDLVFLGGDYQGAGRVVALDVTRDYVPKIWELMVVKGGLASTPAIFDDVLYIGGGDGNVYAVAAVNREALWPLKDNAFKTEGPIVADVAVDETGVYVASTDSRLYCLQRGSGRLKWQYHGGRALTEDPVVTPAGLYLPIPDTGMAMFDKGDGEFLRKPKWIVKGMTQFLAEDERMVYLLRGADNAVVAVDKATGQQRFTSNRRDLISFATNRKGDGVIYAASKTNRVMAIKPVLRPGVVGELVLNEVPMNAAGAPVLGG
jgi:outer membrane protein assembly factor BamB